MKVRTALRLSIFALFILGGSIYPRQSHAQPDPTLGTEATSINKVSSEFSSFLGDDATAVITGLRNGTPITLTTTDNSSTPTGSSVTTADPNVTTTTTQTGTPLTTTTTITPPTGKMGLGNVRISLALAKAQLSQYNIDQPTSDQLSATLLGGSITTGSGTTATTTQIQGVLTMRSEGMGWGQIAQELGYKLGPIISGRQTIVATTTEGGVVDVDGQTVSTEGGVVTGSGKSAGKSGNVVGNSGRGKGLVTGTGRAFGPISVNRTHGKSAVVTGSGRSVGSSSVITTGRGHGYGRGIVSGSGRSVGASIGITMGLGGGSGLSKRGGVAGLGRSHKN